MGSTCVPASSLYGEDGPAGAASKPGSGAGWGPNAGPSQFGERADSGCRRARIGARGRAHSRLASLCGLAVWAQTRRAARTRCVASLCGLAVWARTRRAMRTHCVGSDSPHGMCVAGEGALPLLSRLRRLRSWFGVRAERAE